MYGGYFCKSRSSSTNLVSGGSYLVEVMLELITGRIMFYKIKLFIPCCVTILLIQTTIKVLQESRHQF